MKKILITGKNSYVGNSFETWLKNYPSEYEVNKISLRNDSWKEHDFSVYDSVIHVAGIAHRKETKENEQLYYKVNRDLAYEVAEKAKDEVVPHFIFLSSMSVYGMDTGVINQETVPDPKSNYGKSKLQAEELIDSLKDESFKVAILRPPMIYGKGCKGNYPRLAKLALKTPVFPIIENQRSMLYVGNLSVSLKYIIDNRKVGLFFPQNNEFVNTSKMVYMIAKHHHKSLFMTRILNPFLFIMRKNGKLKKVFGNLVYEKKLSKTGLTTQDYTSLEESIRLTEH